jgi:hypothetical protein
LDKDPLAKTARKTWCKCADELGEMIQEEYKSNPRYHGVKMFWSNDKKSV